MRYQQAVDRRTDYLDRFAENIFDLTEYLFFLQGLPRFGAVTDDTGAELARGEGFSKKEAEQAAAQDAIGKMKNV